MKRTVLIIALALFCAFVFAQERIAVLPFEDLDNILTNSEYTLFNRQFGNEFSKITAGKFTVIPRLDVEKLFSAEEKFQLSDLSAKLKTAETQRVLNGTQILYGAIGKMGSRIMITISLYTFPELIQLPGGFDVYITNKDELSGKIPELVQKMQGVINNTAIIPGGNEDSEGRPNWILIPLNGKVKFESGGAGVSRYYYDVGMSNKTSTEQLARTRAKENVQQMVAANIASEMKGRIDITQLSMFDSSDIEDTSNKIETAITNSIRTKVPSYETLEWFIEKGRENNRNYFIAYVLIRFNRQDIIKDVETININNVADTVIKNMKIKATDDEKADFISELEDARDVSVRSIRNGLSGR
jgi:hypothetical protein